MQDRDNFLCMQCWPFSCAGECNRVGHLCPTLTASEVQPYSCISILPRSPKDAFATAPVPKHEQIQQVRAFPVFSSAGKFSVAWKSAISSSFLHLLLDSWFRSFYCRIFAQIPSSCLKYCHLHLDECLCVCQSPARPAKRSRKPPSAWRSGALQHEREGNAIGVVEISLQPFLDETI